MQRVPTQAALPFGRKEKVINRQWRQRARGEKVTRAPGRPRSKHAGVSHLARPPLRQKSALHVTLRVTRAVPNLRTRRRYAVIRNAFVKFCAPAELGFRLVHFAVLSNHVHFVIEADSKRALSMGMQKLLHSISRRLNALSLREHGERQSTKAGSYRALKGWLGRVFTERYHAHLLRTPTEMHNAVRYVRFNAAQHYTEPYNRSLAGTSSAALDPFSSFAACPCDEAPPTSPPRNFLLRRVCLNATLR
jgi:REP element-mobilizing transposase RayT